MLLCLEPEDLMQSFGSASMECNLGKQLLLVIDDENEHLRDYKSKEAQPKEREEHAI